MILTQDEIRREIDEGRLEIDPLRPECIGPASVDLHLGDEIRVMNGPPGVVPVTEDTDYEKISRVLSLREPYLLRPNETILGITQERIRLPGDLAGWLEGRSRYARLGLTVHVTAGFIAPGVDGRQVLEMSNVASHPLAIHAGVRLLQIILQRCEGSARYTGRFARQQRL